MARHLIPTDSTIRNAKGDGTPYHPTIQGSEDDLERPKARVTAGFFIACTSSSVRVYPWYPGV